MNRTPPPSSTPPSPDTDAKRQVEACLDTLRTTLGRLRYGQVTVMVHDGRIVQLEITEKQRIAPH